MRRTLLAEVIATLGLPLAIFALIRTRRTAPAAVGVVALGLIRVLYPVAKPGATASAGCPRTSGSGCAGEDGGARPRLRLARVKPNALAVLRADGFVDGLGADRIHGDVDRAVEAQLRG